METIWTREGSVRDWIAQIAKDGNYTLTMMSRYSVRIKTTKLCVVISDRWVGEGLMHLLMRYRAHVRKRMEDGLIDLSDDGDPEYSREGGSLTRSYRDAEECDLSSAHATTLYQINGIDDWMHAKLQKYSKESRLMIVGSLGSTKTITRYESNSPVDDEEKTEPTKPVYEKICRMTDRIMRELMDVMGKDAYYYYWDAVYVRPGCSGKVRKYMADRGYRIKVKPARIKGIYGKIVTEDGRVYGGTVHEMSDYNNIMRMMEEAV